MPSELSYNGVPLVVPNAELLAWLYKYLPAQAFDAPQPVGWPASNLAGLAAFAYPPHWRGRAGSLYWPAGASRCAFGHFVASFTQIDSILADFDPNGDPQPEYTGQALPLVMRFGDDQGGVSPNLYVLPPRPLFTGAKSASNDPLYLLTFVDQRYYWWGTITDDTLKVLDSTTTWNSLIQAIATLLSVTIGDTTVDTATFGYAPAGLDLSGLPAPVALDAICYACGLRVSVDTSGAIWAKSADADYTALSANLDAGFPEMSGAPFRLDVDRLPPNVTLADDQTTVLPATVRIVTEAGDGPHTDDVDVLAQDPDLFEGVRVGVTRAWVTRRDSYDGTAGPLYAAAFAKSYGKRLVSMVARQYAGIVDWEPEGISEAVEWVWTRDEVVTFVHPRPWDDGVTETAGMFQDGGSGIERLRVTGAGVNGFSGTTVYPTVLTEFDRDSGNWADSDGGETEWMIPNPCAFIDTSGASAYWCKDLKFRVTPSGEDDRPVFAEICPASGCCSCPEDATDTDCVLVINGSICDPSANTVSNITTTLCFDSPFRIKVETNEADLPPCPQGDPGAKGDNGNDGNPAIETTTSTTSLALGTGSKSFTTATALTAGVGAFLQVSRTSDPTNKWMYGQITSIATTSVTIDSQLVKGAGTHTDWTATVVGSSLIGCVEVIDPGSLSFDTVSCTIGYTTHYLHGLFFVDTTPC